MKQLIYMFVVVTLCSCIYDNEPVSCPSAKVAVEMTVRPDPMTVVTRTTDETMICDVNLYLCDATGSVVRHSYTTTSTLRFTCAPGTYRMYVAANLGHDTGEDTLPTHLQIEHADMYDILPMTYEGDVTISASSQGIVLLPTVEVRRIVAKIAYNISVADSVSDIKLRCVQVCNQPCWSVPFAAPDNHFMQSYIQGPLLKCENSGCHSATFYMFENMQGVVSAITTPEQKGSFHAPENATCIVISAVHSEKILSYHVYLGENNTSDFNVRRNTSQTYDITIRGDNEIDTRVSSCAVHVWDNMEQFAEAGYCLSDAKSGLFIDIESGNGIPKLSCEINVLNGDGTELELDGATVGSKRLLPFAESVAKHSYELVYNPQVFNGSNSTLAYNVIVSDEYGGSRMFEFTHRFANLLQVNVQIKGVDNGQGSVVISEALHSRPLEESEVNLLALCSDAGCLLKAVPGAGYRFAGWYSDTSMTDLISNSTSYRYIPISSVKALYAKFTLDDHYPLDDSGTANCYIAPYVNTRYSFSARVMGNDKTTTGIVPRTLVGTTAKVLWETGAGRGSVIKYVAYDNGRIYFSTGAVHGNAVIGLFDTADNCVWSWHIWAVDYEPEVLAEKYGSGVLFMNRNLGAESASASSTKSLGLYYQWGRKDPFVFPASQKVADNTISAVTYHLEDYEFSSGRTLDKQCHSLEWATAHPTTVLVNAPNPKGGYPATFSSWLSVPNTNLWGKDKTIYDPCPPGWKIPARGAWDATTFKYADSESGYGLNMLYSDRMTARACYPFNGYLTVSDAGWQYLETKTAVRLWTSEPNLNTNKDSGYYLHIADYGTATTSARTFQQDAQGIRCIKE